jgi:hypothetical protein
MQYPSNLTNQQDNLVFHTIVGFQLIHENILDFTNTTSAELDLRVYNAPQNETFANLNIGQINNIAQTNTSNQLIVGHYKNATSGLGGLPALKIINYLFIAIADNIMLVTRYQDNSLLEIRLFLKVLMVCVDVRRQVARFMSV